LACLGTAAEFAQTTNPPASFRSNHRGKAHHTGV
jgi:hypothetical protein